MSRPENVLSQFRSYSYHHVLIACNNDAAADYLSGPDATLDTFRRLRSPETIQVDKTENDGSVSKLAIGNYVVLLNGMIDTTFVVQRAEWFTATAASTDVRDRFNSIAVEGTIEIQEPRGIRFMNALNEAADSLGSDPNGLIFLLKTIFVGHGVREDGTEFTDHITNVRPLRFIIENVTGTFSTSGGTYVISFAGVSNGAARFPQYSRITENINLLPKNEQGSDTMVLATALNNLAEEMTRLAQANRTCIVNKLKEQYGGQPREGGGTLDDLRGVKYQIIAEPPYTLSDPNAVGFNAPRKPNPDYVVDGLLAQQGDDGQGVVGPLKFGPDSTVEQAIRHIMDRCEKVKEDRNKGDGEITYIYKIHSKLSMEGQSETGNSAGDATQNYSNIVVRYFVRRFAQVTNSTVEKVLGIDPEGQPTEEVQNTINQNTIEFDYFFTGKNTDIINFDIKMEMGLAFLQALATTNTLPTQIEQVTNRGVPTNSLIIVPQENQKGSEDQDEERTPRIVIRNQTPIFPATRVKDVGVRNTANPESGALFQAYLSRHAALENLEANITIAGNPYLMSQTNKQANETSRSQTTQSAGSSPETVLQNWDTIPGLAKINIFMPANNDTPSSQESFVSERFWYNGYYYLHSIKHVFDQGQFTQDLQLLSLPNESLIETNDAEEITECGPTPKTEQTEGGTSQQTETASADANVTGAQSVGQNTRSRRDST